MKNYKYYYRRNLPHYQPLGYSFIVTFRLAGSLPVSIISRLKAERNDKLKIIAGIQDQKEKNDAYYSYQKKYFYKFDLLLGKTHYGPKWLGDEIIASVVNETITRRDKGVYDLIAYTIMPNHIHMVFTPIVKRIADSLLVSEEIMKNERNSVSSYIVTKILQDLKKYTGGKCNKILNRDGTFWQHESYDHVVCNSTELRRLVKYVLNNPVKAGLAEKWEDWNWSYFNSELLV